MNMSKKHRKHITDKNGVMGYMLWTRRNNNGYYKQGFPNTSTRKYFLIIQVGRYRITKEYRTKDERLNNILMREETLFLHDVGYRRLKRKDIIKTKQILRRIK